jgi:transcriptional regulator with XRE-family HTH domain
VDEKSLAVRVGGRLRKLRQDRGLTLTALSQECGVSVSYLSAVETGINHPSLHTLAAITEALGASIAAVLAHEVQETMRRASVPDRTPGMITISHPLLTLRATIISATQNDRGTCPVDLDDRHLFVYVIAGTVTVHLDGEKYTLNTGDALDATEPHEVTWQSPHESTVTWVSCPSRPH